MKEKNKHYTRKWVEENLGISLSAIKGYEKYGLLNKKDYENPNNKYREFSEEQVETIWYIRFLNDMHFTLKEIQQFMREEDFDFFGELVKKISIMEEEKEKLDRSIRYAKTIKATGMIPTIKEVGTVTFQKFRESIDELWTMEQESLDLRKDLATLSCIDPSNVDPSNLSPDTIDALERVFSSIPEDFDFEKIQDGYLFDAYNRILCDMQDYDHSSDVVQSIVRSLYYFHKKFFGFENEPQYNEDFFSRYYSSNFLKNADIAVPNMNRYGERGCAFIEKAVLYFGEHAGENNNTRRIHNETGKEICQRMGTRA